MNKKECREIKFRVWDNKTKKYATDGMIYFFDIIAGRNKRYLLEQYTGLKDKNGKDIYEGDIVDTGKIYGLYKVVFNEYICGFVFEDGKGRKTKSGTEHPQFSQDWQTVEVIGNIHQNKFEGGKLEKWKTKTSKN